MAGLGFETMWRMTMTRMAMSVKKMKMIKLPPSSLHLPYSFPNSEFIVCSPGKNTKIEKMFNKVVL